MQCLPFSFFCGLAGSAVRGSIRADVQARGAHARAGGTAVLLVLTLWCAAPADAQAVGPVDAAGVNGTPGPTGPIGVDAGRNHRSRHQAPAAPPAAQPAARADAGSGSSHTGNRIEVTGNAASGTAGCSPDGTASVNSIDVTGARLEGKTVIVQGRNTNDVKTPRDCPGARPHGPGSGQTNSIRIR